VAIAYRTVNHNRQSETNPAGATHLPMMDRFLPMAGAALALLAMPAGARVALDDDRATVTGGGSASLPPYLQCVPYARQVSGIKIFGDAHSWWGQAAGKYARGSTPRVGAVMAFRPSGNSRLGHVAAVSRIIDERTILVRHSNWSPINGRRGQIEDNVRVVDVSAAGDWSAVRVWYAPIQSLGSGHWPIQGFIYPAKPAKGEKLDGREPERAIAPSAPKQAEDPIADLIKDRLGW
jgi:surface antigen